MSRDFPRIYLEADEKNFSSQDEIFLSPAHAHYLSSVMRATVGGHIRVFNGRDGEWDAEILEIKKQKIRIILQEKLREQYFLKPKRLLFSPLKRDATELIYRMGTELGVTCFQPIITARTNTHRLNLQRLALITQEAAEQCERLDVPELCEAKSLKSLLSYWSEEHHIGVAIERGEERGVPLLKGSGCEGHCNKEVSSLLIGPEGGFSDEEVSLLKKYPFIYAFSLGNLVLRAETAVVAALSQLDLMCSTER